jgi:hypothetical protein
MFAVVVGFFFFLAMSGGSSSDSDDRSGQAKRPTIKKESSIPGLDGLTNLWNSAPSLTSGNFNENDIDLDMEEAVDGAEKDFAMTEAEQIQSNLSMLTTAMTSINEAMRSQLNDLLGDDDNYDTDDLEVLGNSIESQLNDKTMADFKEKADAIKTKKTEYMEMTVDLETEGNSQGETAAAEDVKTVEANLVKQLKGEINDMAMEMKNDMKHQCAVITKQVLEQSLKKKMGTSYTVDISDTDEVVGYGQGKSASSKPKKSSSSSTKKKKKPTSSHHSSSSNHHSSSKNKHTSTKKKKKKKKKYVSPSSVSESESESVSESESESGSESEDY